MSFPASERGQDRSPRKHLGRLAAQIGVPLLTAMVGLYGLLALGGTLLVHGWVPPFVTRWDHGVSDWAFAHRTPALNRLTHFGTLLAETFTVIAIAVVAVIILRLWLRRWRESLVVAVVVLGELVIFLAVTATVHRPRPSVPHLDPAPPTSSFPSGHTGAAVALYGCLALIALRNVRPRWAAVTLAVVGFAIPVFVGMSRIYRGMHYVSDVIAGALAGGLWIAVVLLVLLPRHPPDRHRRPDPQGSGPVSSVPDGPGDSDSDGTAAAV